MKHTWFEVLGGFFNLNEYSCMKHYFIFIEDSLIKIYELEIQVRCIIKCYAIIKQFGFTAYDHTNFMEKWIDWSRDLQFDGTVYLIWVL